MTSCLNEETMQAYFDGELASEATAQVIRHLAECDGCAATAFEVERAIELMSSAFEDELPAVVPSARLRARIDAALGGDSVAADPPRPARRFWPHVFDAPIANLSSWTLSPRRLAYAALGILALISAFWFGARSGFFSQKSVQQVQTPTPAPTPGDQQQTPQIARKSAPGDEIGKSEAVGAQQKTKSQRSVRTPAQRRYDLSKRQAPIAPIPNERDDLDQWIAGTGNDSLQVDTGVFDPGMVRHFEKAQILLRSFRNSDPSARGFTSELAYERRQSKSLLYSNIILRREAEKNGNLPAEEVLGSLEPVLLDIANLPDRPSPDDVRSIKERIHKREIIGVLQVYSAPSVVAYQP